MMKNERTILPYFIQHYRRIAERIVIADNESTDSTASFAWSLGAEVEEVKTDGRFSGTTLRDWKNERWKESIGKADYVIVCDADEFLWHPNLEWLLETQKRNGVTLPRVRGFEMVSEKFPTTPGQIYEEVKHGFREARFDKHIIFDPNELEINYDYGAHHAYPQGNVKLSHLHSTYLLLHFRFVGRERFMRKYGEKEFDPADPEDLNGTVKWFGVDLKAEDHAWVEKAWNRNLGREYMRQVVL
jgi:glycosyltransferase involved in cell wall biosynthesis